jgi:hypothetical protein
MHRRTIQRGLPRMFNGSAYAGEQEIAARDRLHPCIGLGRPAIPAPVVDQRYSSRTGLAALNVLRGKAAPAPLVLQLIKAVLAVGPIPVELAKGLQ